MARNKSQISVGKALDRHKFERLVERKARSFDDVVELKENRALLDITRVFLLEDILDIAYDAFSAGWTMCQMQDNDKKSRHSTDKGTKFARQIIMDAFK